MKISLQNSENDKKRFYGEVVTVASAICMHNMFPHTFVERHGYESLKLDRHPLAFLLILCDELQEWNRKGYGAHMTETFWPRESLVDVTDTRLRVNYRVEWGEYGQEFAEDKKKNLQTYLDTVSAFPEGIAISCSSNNSAAYLEMKLRNGTGSITPRPIIDNIIALARKIHENYNRQRQIDNPQAKLEYPQWDELSQDLKYSNMSQALSMNKTLNACGYVITKTDTGVDKFPPEDVETMSILEHDRWVTERISNGWVYGPEKNVELRTSPYIVPWEDLKENIRELDRQAIRNIPGLLKEIGLGAVKKY